MAEKETKCCCCNRKKERSEKEYKDLINRLSRIEGQIRGIKRMIKNTETINVEIADLSEAQLDSLKQLHNAYQVSFENGQLRIYFSGGRHNIIHVLDYLEQNNLSFGQVYTQLPTLNDVFLEITGKELRD